MRYSSRSPEQTIRVSPQPPSSRIARTARVTASRSPESSRTARGTVPVRRAASQAARAPSERVVGVDQERRAAGWSRMKAQNASTSVGNAST